MSRRISNSMSGLLECLDLETIELDLFRGKNIEDGRPRIFGGQVIGQSLLAAQRTIDADRHVHSLHAYFMRPGDPSVPIVFSVDRIRDGKSFATRSVVAIQHGKAIFSLSASFQKEEPGLEYQADMPEVPQPEELPGTADLDTERFSHAPANLKAYMSKERPFDLKPVSLAHYLTNEKLPPRQDAWIRANGPVPDNRIIRAAILAYLSDMMLLDTALFVHGRSVFDKHLQVASLDHAMWFHRPVSFDDWLLYSMDSPNTNSARGLSRGSFYSRDGSLIASVAQEGLIRERD